MRSTRQRSTLVGLPNASKSLDRAKSIVTANHDTVSLFINNSSELITALYWNKTLDRIARATPIDFATWADSDVPLSEWFDSYGTGSASLHATNGLVFCGEYFLAEKDGSPRLTRDLSSCAMVSKAPTLTVNESFYGLGLGSGAQDYIAGEGQTAAGIAICWCGITSGVVGSLIATTASVLERDRLCLSRGPHPTTPNSDYTGPTFGTTTIAGEVTMSFTYATSRNGNYRLVIGQRPVGADVATMDFSVTSLD